MDTQTTSNEVVVFDNRNQGHASDQHSNNFPAPDYFTTSSIALIPVGARELVLKPLRNVRLFVSIFMAVTMIVLGLVGVILSSIPPGISAFGALLQTVLVILSLVFFVSVVLAVNWVRIDLLYQLQRLEAFCKGDVMAAGPIAQHIAMDSSTVKLGVFLDVIEKIKIQEIEELKATIDAANMEEGSSGTVRGPVHEHSSAPEPHSHEGTRLLPKPEGPFQDAPEDLIPESPERTLQAVHKCMEVDPLFSISQTIGIVMGKTYLWVILMPLIYFLGGYALCKLGAPFNGSEIIFTAFMLGAFGPLLWGQVKDKTSQELYTADSGIRALQKLAADKKKEAEHKRETESKKVLEEIERKREEERKSRENRQSRNGNEPNFFGIQFPKFNFNQNNDK